MKNNKVLTKEDILHLSKLANIKLSDEEIKKYQKQLSEILNYIDQLNEVDISQVEGTTHTINLVNILKDDYVDSKRNINDQTHLKIKVRDNKKFFSVSRIL